MTITTRLRHEVTVGSGQVTQLRLNAADEIDRLTTERDEARAQVAMAYEVADGVLGKHCFHEGHWARRDIRALTPDDAKAALEARDAAKDAEIDRLRSALEACLNYIENTEGEFGIILDCADKGRAALTDTPQDERTPS